MLIAAGVFLLACLVGYDFTLKAEYEKGAYKSRFYGMTEIKIKDFDKIKHKCGNMIGLRVEQGKTYGVWMQSFQKDWIKFSQQGETLNIDYVGKEEESWGSSVGIIIICPKISQVDATTYMPKLPGVRFSLRGLVEVAGFKQTVPLSISAGAWTDFYLTNNKLTQLNADFGFSSGDEPNLTIDNNNIIHAANLNLKGNSTLNLYSPAIAQPNYHFGDSTRVTLSGSSLKLVQPK